MRNLVTRTPKLRARPDKARPALRDLFKGLDTDVHHGYPDTMILITEFMDAGAVARLSASHPTEYRPELADDQAAIPEKLSDIRALIVRNRTQVTVDLLDAAPALRIVGRLGVGLDNIDLEACADRGVHVQPATGANAMSVAEYVITNAALLLRGAYQANGAMLRGEWPRAACAGRELAGHTLGLIGFGTIARLAAEKAQALGMTVCAFDPHLAQDDPCWGNVRSLSLEDVLKGSDVVSLHVPLTPTTRHLLNAETLSLMKPEAVVINTARGGVIDDAAVAAALRNGTLGGAALDVFETEPLTQEAAIVFEGAANLILTPHIAGVTEESNLRVSDMIADAVLEALRTNG